MITKQSAIDSLFASSIKMGGDVSIALGPVGVGAIGDLPTTFVSFAKTKGLYAGLDLNGSVIAVRDSLNKAYYGRKVTSMEIVVEKKVSKPSSTELLTALKKAVK